MTIQYLQLKNTFYANTKYTYSKLFWLWIWCKLAPNNVFLPIFMHFPRKRSSGPFSHLATTSILCLLSFSSVAKFSRINLRYFLAQTNILPKLIVYLNVVSEWMKEPIWAEKRPPPWSPSIVSRINEKDIPTSDHKFLEGNITLAASKGNCHNNRR